MAMKWQDKFTNFMYGRYGVDKLSKFMLIVTFVLCIISMFVHSSIISLLILALIIYTYYRMFSRDIYKRAAENEKYLRFVEKIKGKAPAGAYRNTQEAQQRKYYKFFKCPECSQKIRIPKGHGKIEIRCPKCNTKFIRKS